MSSDRPLIVAPDCYTLNPGDQTWDALHALGELRLFDRSSPAEVIDRCRDAQVVLSNKLQMDASVLDQLPKLKLIAVTATGYNGIDTAAAKARGIVVCNVPKYSTDTVAQFTLALMLEWCHRIGRHDESVHRGDWVRSPDFCYWLTPQRELAGRTIGIIGFGRIGRRVGELASAFKMRVLAIKPSRPIEPAFENFKWATLDELLANSNYVSLHCPLTPATKQLINAERLSQMNREAVLINTSRGGLVDEQALADALNANTIAGAAVDVVTAEPMAAANPLLTAKNCIITPHIAWTSLDARKRVMKTTVNNVAAFLRGSPMNVVNF